eukprot:CAMPEP_0185276402 /NCGR_PEP_ID=MMETSP1359-20130426/56101_1 /TAXON_ID=552665 /ORGANISM="Bigelowiella longifila, Strain CCMP242" /LENGTH=141 /DNA_ID=CAMNT_0027870057 /DNA_START=106 /DNA_END=531 /DNA_ORIENTATION=+
MTQENRVVILVSNDDDPSPNSTFSLYVSSNEFPYHWEEGLMHLLIWTDEEMKSVGINEFCQAAISRFPKGYEMVIWVNDMSMRSIPGILHAHLLLKPYVNVQGAGSSGVDNPLERKQTAVGRDATRDQRRSRIIAASCMTA